MIAMEHAALRRFVKAAEEFENKFSSIVRFEHGQPHPHLAPTGDLYIEYINGKSSGDMDLAERFDTPDSVIEETFSRLNKSYESGDGLTLYWRVEPEIDFSETWRTWKTYCRFVISDKQVKI